MIYHYTRAIEWFGRIKNFVTEAYEKAHKENCKKPARHTNFNVR
jgi:hypothetical protein